MEWVEVQGKTIDLAVEVALSELGAASRDEVSVEVIQEPKAGFLGMGGQEAIVKVTRAPKKRRRGRGRGKGRDRSSNATSANAAGSGNGAPAASGSSNGGRGGGSNGGRSSKGQGSSDAGRGSKSNQGRNQGRNRSRQNGRQEAAVSDQKTSNGKDSRDDRPEPAPITEQAEVAKGFLVGLLDSFGLEGEVTTRIDDDVLYLDVSGEQTEALVGQKGSVMQSVLELTRTVVQRKTYGAPRMRIDIAGYGERRREALRIYAGKLAEQVIDEQSEIMLEPMNAADRKVLHDAVAEIDGVRSFSEGEEPRRAVVIAYDGE